MNRLGTGNGLSLSKAAGRAVVWLLIVAVVLLAGYAVILSKALRRNADWLPPQLTVSVLMVALPNEDDKAKVRILEALTDLRPESYRAIPKGTAELSSDKTDVVVAALEFLGTCGSRAEQAIPAIVDLLDRPGYHLHPDAYDALSKIGAPAAPELARLIGQGGPSLREAIAALCGIKPPQVQYESMLREMLDSPQVNMRVYAATGLQEMGLVDDELARFWGRELLVSNPYRGSFAIKQIGKLGDKADPAIDVLTDYLNSGEEAMRLQVISSLAQIGPAARRAVPVLEEISESDDSATCRMQAASALEELRPNE